MSVGADETKRPNAALVNPINLCSGQQMYWPLWRASSPPQAVVGVRTALHQNVGRCRPELKTKRDAHLSYQSVNWPADVLANVCDCQSPPLSYDLLALRIRKLCNSPYAALARTNFGIVALPRAGVKLVLLPTTGGRPVRQKKKWLCREPEVKTSQ